MGRERRPAVDGRELPIPFGPGIGENLQLGEQFRAVLAAPSGLRYPAHHLGGLGGIRQDSPQQGSA
jgi:hypothetical protein